MKVGGQRHSPAALPPGKTRYSLYKRLGGHQSRSGQVRKISPSTGIRSPDRPTRSVVAIPTTLSLRPSSLYQPFRCHSVCVSYSFVHSCQQKSIGLKFSKSQTGNDVRYSCHHNSSRFTLPIFAHLCRFSVLHSLQSITPRIY